MGRRYDWLDRHRKESVRGYENRINQFPSQHAGFVFFDRINYDAVRHVFAVFAVWNSEFNARLQDALPQGGFEIHCSRQEAEALCSENSGIPVFVQLFAKAGRLYSREMFIQYREKRFLVTFTGCEVVPLQLVYFRGLQEAEEPPEEFGRRFQGSGFPLRITGETDKGRKKKESASKDGRRMAGRSVFFSGSSRGMGSGLRLRGSYPAGSGYRLGGGFLAGSGYRISGSYTGSGWRFGGSSFAGSGYRLGIGYFAGSFYRLGGSFYAGSGWRLSGSFYAGGGWHFGGSFYTGSGWRMQGSNSAGSAYRLGGICHGQKGAFDAGQGSAAGLLADDIWGAEYWIEIFGIGYLGYGLNLI